MWMIAFLLLNPWTRSINFLSIYVNNKHSNISFTSEMEKNNGLPFLDIMITRDNGYLTTFVFRKDTYTGLGLNYDSFVPNLFKINSIKTLLHRTYNICSTWHYFHSELEKLRNFFSINGYPSNLIEKHIKRFVNKKFVKDNTSIDDKKGSEIYNITFYGTF